MKIISFITIILVTAFTSSKIFAGGTEWDVTPSAKALSLNGLYFAGTDGLNSVLGNPAGLILLNDKYIELSISDVIGQQEYKGDTQGLHKSMEEDHFSFNGGIAWFFSQDFVIGLSYHRAVNNNVNWPFVILQHTDTTEAVTSAAFELFNHINVNAASLSGALRFNEITVGLTISGYQVKQETSFPQKNADWMNNGASPSYQFSYDEDAWTFGFNAGLLYKASAKLQIGLMARSGYTANLSGKAKSNMFADIDSVTPATVNLTSKFEMPWVFGGGLLYNIEENLLINADVQYSIWKGIQKSINYTYNNSVWQNNTSRSDILSGITANKLMLDFNNSIDAGVGLEYLFSDFILRTGYRFSQSPNSNSTFGYLFPSVNQHRVSAGVGYTDENLSFDFAVAYSFGISKYVSGINANYNGRYNSDLVLPTITLRYAL